MDQVIRVPVFLMTALQQPVAGHTDLNKTLNPSDT